MPLGLHQLPTAAADLVLLGDLTGRYAAGSYSRLSSDRQSVVARSDRQGEADHGHRITAAIACHVARAGGTLDQLLRLVMHPDHEGGRHARTIALRSGQARAFDYVRRVWVSASAASAPPSRSKPAITPTKTSQPCATGSRPRHGVANAAAQPCGYCGPKPRVAVSTAPASGRRPREAGVSRQTLRSAYETVLKPNGWLHRLRVGHGREGSTWYLGRGHKDSTARSLSRIRTTQFPPDRELEEWPTPETGMTVTADIDSILIGRLMGHDAFAHHGLGGSALMVIGALRVRPGQTASELVASSSVSRATVYRTLQRLAAHGLVTQNGRAWTLTPCVLEDIGQDKDVDPSSEAMTAQVWDTISHCYGTTGTERQPSSEGLPGPATARIDPDWRVATDGRLILITPADQRTYDELVAAHTEAISEWESAA